MNEIERILDQLKRAYEGNAWHGPSVKEALAGVTAQQAHARPLANAHSIWELARHIAVWEDAGRRRLGGDRAQIEISSPQDWPPPDDPSDAAWEEAKAALDRMSTGLAIETCQQGVRINSISPSGGARTPGALAASQMFNRYPHNAEQLEKQIPRESQTVAALVRNRNRLINHYRKRTEAVFSVFLFCVICVICG